MTSKPVAFLLADLGVTKTHSRPHVSNDNPYSEAQFKTLKYRPDFPDRFGCIEDARAFCDRFFRLVQPRAPPLRHRLAHPRRRPLRPRRRRPEARGRGARRRLRRAPRALRPQATRAAGLPSARLDQQARDKEDPAQ